MSVEPQTLELRPVTIWHNPNCSKSRKTLELLQSLGWVDIIVREYLDDAPTADELRDLMLKLAASEWPVSGPRDIIRANEPPYAQQGLDNAALSDDELLDAIAGHPVLLQRPIVICGARAVVARPNYRALAVLSPEGEPPPLHEVMKSKIKQEGV